VTFAATTARWLAILIALLGVLDPIVVSPRATRAEIAVLASADSALTRRVIDRLDDHFTVVRGQWPRAAATVVVGAVLPDRIPPGPVYVVADEGEPRMASFVVPKSVPLDARFSTSIAWNGSASAAELRAGGVVVDTAVVQNGTNDARLLATATTPGPLLLRARVGDLTADALTNVVDHPHAVLFFDRRPSWMSTFVRRSLEQDRRFAVASRVITSRGVSTDAGQPPSTLSDPSLLELYDVIVVGAPSSLTSADVAGLEAFLRRRGGSVVMLYDEKPVASPVDRLTGASRWTPTVLRNPVTATATDDSSALRISELAWPTTLPTTATERATASVNGASHAVVWTNGLGAGQVIVSGALDSWKFRDEKTSGFDEFWRATISRAAREAEDAVAVDVEPNVAMPGERLTVRITVRDTTARPVVTLDSSSVGVWPSDHAGEFIARLKAPTDGDHWLRATASGARAEAPVAIRDRVRRAESGDLTTARMLARATGGMAGSLDQVDAALRRNVTTERRMERWWPMRAGWWIVPFAGLLGFEWFVRRRRGLA
jgi:hypothetical protein